MLALESGFSGLFKVLLVLHILTAIVGLGGVMLNGLYAAQAQKRPGPAGPGGLRGELRGLEHRRELHLPRSRCSASCSCSRATSVFKFSQTFVWLVARCCYIIALGHLARDPDPGSQAASTRCCSEMEQGPPPAGGPPPQVAQIQALGKKHGRGAAMMLDLLLVVILVLMIWKPGSD